MSTMIQPIKNKFGVYTLRKAVPLELRDIIGKSAIKRSLNTKILAEAKLKSAAVIAEMEAILQQARRTLQAEQSVTFDDIESVASVWATKILPQADLIEERYLYLYPYGLDLNPESTQIKRYLNEREQHSKQWQDKWNLDLMQLVQREIAEALEWTPIELTHAWRNELAWRLADRRNQAAEMLILDILPKHSATVKQPAQPSSITFSELFIKYQDHIRYAESARAEKRIIEYSTAVGRFIEFIGAKPIDAITVKDMADFRILMEQQPFRPSKAIKQRPLTEQAKVEGKKISPERVRNLLMALSAIFTIAVENQWITSNPVRELPKRKRQRTNSDDKPFTKSEISQIFSTPLFQGEASPHGAMAYWIPLILYYTGARVEEIAQLYKKNITVENGLHCLKIQMKDDQSVKDGLSRLVPLCDHLIELGFLNYANSREHHLFTEEKNPAGKYSYNFLRWFGNYIRKHGVTRKEISPTHSFRHTFISYCRDNGTREDMQDSILGHAPKSVSRSYGVYSVESKKTEIEKIPRLDLQRLDIWTGRTN